MKLNNIIQDLLEIRAKHGDINIHAIVEPRDETHTVLWDDTNEITLGEADHSAYVDAEEGQCGIVHALVLGQNENREKR